MKRPILTTAVRLCIDYGKLTMVAMCWPAILLGELVTSSLDSEPRSPVRDADLDDLLEAAMTEQLGSMRVHKKLRTASDPVVQDCVSTPGTEHDLRPYGYIQHNRPHVSLVCVWCGGVACGTADDIDPCTKIYHHTDEHKSRFGERWPIGGSRVEPVEP